ncbi:B3 domain-containing transcription factor VRN1 [Linum perenne]
MADFSDDKPRFFKIILQTTIDNGRLMIPSSFSRKHYGEDDSYSISSNPTSAILRTPNGLRWEVEILKTCVANDQPEVWIQGNAWEQFVSSHNLKQGHFIVFQYEGGSLFSIFVFGLSGSEIRYPSEKIEEAAEFQDVDEISVEIISKMEEENAACSEDDVSLEILPDLDAGPSPVLKSRKQRRGNLKKQKTNSSDGDDDSVEILTDSESGSSGRTPRKQSKKADSRLNHPSFSVVIRPSYIRGGLCIPREFGRKHLMLEDQTQKLQVANCREEWEVEAQKVNGRDAMYLTTGWSEFRKSNSIQIDDVCEFEVIGVDENGLMVLQVSITRRKKMK